MCLIIAFDKKGEYLLVLLAALIHEGGHMLYLLLSGKRIEQVRVIPGGFDIRYQNNRDSYLSDILASASGPAANLAAAFIFSRFGYGSLDYFVGANAVLCFFNLLPVYPLDGGRILYSVMEFFSPANGRQLFLLFSTTASLLLFLASAAAFCLSGRAVWSMVIFGIILLSQRLGYIWREAI